MRSTGAAARRIITLPCTRAVVGAQCTWHALTTGAAAKTVSPVCWLAVLTSLTLIALEAKAQSRTTIAVASVLTCAIVLSVACKRAHHSRTRLSCIHAFVNVGLRSAHRPTRVDTVPPRIPRIAGYPDESWMVRLEKRRVQLLPNLHLAVPDHHEAEDCSGRHQPPPHHRRSSCSRPTLSARLNWTTPRVYRASERRSLTISFPPACASLRVARAARRIGWGVCERTRGSWWTCSFATSGLSPERGRERAFTRRSAPARVVEAR